MIVSVVLWIVGAAFVANFVLRAWVSSGRLRPKNRPLLIRAGMDAVVALALVRALVPPPGLASWAWVIGVVAVGVGVAGAILRWSNRFGWSQDPNEGRERWWPTVVYGAVVAGLLVILA